MTKKYRVSAVHEDGYIQLRTTDERYRSESAALDAAVANGCGYPFGAVVFVYDSTDPNPKWHSICEGDEDKKINEEVI
jgi:hypothetical protein